MKVFVAGATGVLGRGLIPQLVARGHEVVGMTRSASKQDLVRSLGARPVVADALDPDAAAQSVASAEPEVIVHQLTALSGKMSIRDAAPRALQGRDHDQPAAYRGDGSSLGRRPCRGGTALRGAELWGFPFRPHGRAGADRGRSPRSRIAGGSAAGARGDPLSGAGGDHNRVGRGSRVALRRLLRAGHRDRGERIESPRAYLSTAVSRLSLDHFRSAAVRRETYVGEWLPEPLVTSADDDPARKAEMADSLSLAFLVLLESLSPEQRAAFLLREVFDEPYDRIAEIVGTIEQNAHQLATRARRHVEQRRPRFEASREQREELATRFFAAAEKGDLEGLEQRLAHDVVLRGDGGGKAPALARALPGRAKVARTLIAGMRGLARFGLILRREQVNGQPAALVVDREGRLIGVMILDVAEGQVQGVSSIANRDKLRHLGPLADLGALRRERS